MFASIPEEYRQGIDGVEPLRKTVPHPTIPDVFTLGECLSEHYPSDFGGAGDIQSRVVLYYGSFLELSRSDKGWDWEEELWETITHEIRHHLEHLASDDALDELDYAEDQNFARRDGNRFDPFFHRSGVPIAEGRFEVDGDVFIELEVDVEGNGRILFEWEGEELEVGTPDDLGDIHFARVGDITLYEDGDLFLVLIRRRRAREWLRGVFVREPLRIVESTVSVARRQGDGRPSSL